MADGQGIQISERDKVIQAYHAELMRYEAQRVEHELALRSAFQNLLAHFAQQVKWALIPEQTLATGARPDGSLRDRNFLYRGYWEAKDTRDDLNAEIAKKIARGYPTTNTIFEDTQRAVLYQNGRRVDKRSGITSDPNRADDPQYIVRLVGQVVTVSVETVRLVRALAAGVALPEPVAVEVAAN